MADNQVTTSGSHQAPATTRPVRPYTADFAKIAALIGTEDTNRSLKIDLQMPRGVLKAVATAFLAEVTAGNAAPNAAAILAGPYKESVVEALENACHECAARKTPRVIVPLVDVATSPLRMIVVDLFKAPHKVSPKIKAPAVPYELEFVGKANPAAGTAVAGKSG